MERATRRPGFQETSKVAQKFITNEINLDETIETQSEAVADESDNDEDSSSESSYEDCSDNDSNSSSHNLDKNDFRVNSAEFKENVEKNERSSAESESDSENSSTDSESESDTASSSESEDGDTIETPVNHQTEFPISTGQNIPAINASSVSPKISVSESYTDPMEGKFSKGDSCSLRVSEKKHNDNYLGANSGSKQSTIFTMKSPDLTSDARVRLKLKELNGEKKKLADQNQLVLQLREKMEREKYDFEIEKRKFYRYKETELVKLQATKAALDKQQLHFDLVAEESKKCKETNAKHLAEISSLKRKIDSLEKEMKQKTTTWEASKQKLQDWIQELESEREKLENEGNGCNKSSLSNSSSSSSIRYTKMKKRIHFADEQEVSNGQSHKETKTVKHAFGTALKNTTCDKVKPCKKVNNEMVRTTGKRNGQVDHSRMKRPVLKSVDDCDYYEKENEINPCKNGNDNDKIIEMDRIGDNSDIREDDNEPLETVLPNGDTQLLYPNGTKKVISKDRYHMRYGNDNSQYTI